jgi:hypothetical protein
MDEKTGKGRMLFKAVKMVMNMVEKKERKVETNMSLYFWNMEV